MGKNPYFLAAQSAIDQCNDSLNTIFSEFIADFFVTYPEVAVVAWRQYTPSGLLSADYGEFHCENVRLGIIPPEGMTDYDNCIEAPDRLYQALSWDWNEEKQQRAHPYAEFDTMLFILHDQLQQRYGDNVEVFLYPDKVWLEEYDCGY